MASGYTAIEEYCNLAAARLIQTWGAGAVQLYDFNDDGELGVADVIGLILLARQNPENEQLDVNRDGRFTMADAIQLLLVIKNS